MKIFKPYIILVITLFIASALADDVEVVIEPKEAVINESFFITFKIKASSDDEPYISFTPYGASVLGKTAQGLSISTTVINGKFTTTKEQAVVYELLAERSGQVYLRNVKIEVNGKTIPVKEIRVNVLSQARKVQDSFMEAEASKTRVFLGEGLDVNYYLYFKSSIAANDVKEFPKLNKFIKRFHHINSPSETVQYKGQIFKRFLAYSARLYPEKVGTAVLDPMRITIQVVENDYSGFGFGTQRYKNKELASPQIEIEVLPLPAEGVPASFTGLVGEHEFSLSMTKSKYLVNEPIEIKLEAKGKGALENFDSPMIYSDKNLEQFDTKSEVTELGMQAAKKVFEYTLLARGPVNIPARELALAYFDPASGRYIEKKVSVPALEVSGEAMAASGQGSSQKTETPTDTAGDGNSLLNSFLGPKKKEIDKNSISLVGPSLQGQARWFDKNLSVLNLLLGLSLGAFCIQWVMAGRVSFRSSDHLALLKKDVALMKKKGLTYSELYRVVSALDKTNKMSTGGVSIINVLNESTLSSEAVEYFKSALLETESGSFAKNNNVSKKSLSFNKKHFKELMKLV